MKLSRRKFTREFKLAAVEQLERGASVAEVARVFEVNPGLLHRWRHEFRQGPGNAFPGEGKRRWEESRERQWWIESAAGLMETTRVERRTGIEGWFDQPGDLSVTVPETVVPPRWKQAVSIFLPFFPLSLLANFLFRPLIGTWPLVLQVLLLTCVLTPLMTYIFLPAVTRLLRPWLQARRRRATP